MRAKVAIFGCGYWGKNLVRNFEQLGALTAVCDLTSAGRETARQISPTARIHKDIDTVLNDPDIHGIVIATPAVTHAEITQKALKAGKDVLCEKPLALRYEDALNSVELAEKNGRILMVGHILEYHPAIFKLRKMIEEGQLGKVQYAYSNRLNLGKIRREENILWSFAPHDIAVILRLFEATPFQVSATGSAHVQPNIVDITVTQLLFDNGQAAHIFVSWLNPFKEQRLVVVGSQKMVTFCDVNKELILYDQRVDIKEGMPIPVKGEGVKIEYSADEPLRLECQAFLNSIQTRQSPITDGHSGLRVLRILQAAQSSLITHGQPVQIPI